MEGKKELVHHEKSQLTESSLKAFNSFIVGSAMEEHTAEYWTTGAIRVQPVLIAPTAVCRG